MPSKHPRSNENQPSATATSSTSQSPRFLLKPTLQPTPAYIPLNPDLPPLTEQQLQQQQQVEIQRTEIPQQPTQPKPKGKEDKGYGKFPINQQTKPTKKWYLLKGIHDHPTIVSPHTSQPKAYYDKDPTQGELPPPAPSDISDAESWNDLLYKAIQQRDRHIHHYKEIQRKYYRVTPPNNNDSQYQIQGKYQRDNYDLQQHLDQKYYDDLQRWQNQCKIPADEAWEYFREYRDQLRNLRDLAKNNWYAVDTQIMNIVTMMFEDYQPEPTIAPLPFRFNPLVDYYEAYTRERRLNPQEYADLSEEDYDDQ